MDIVYYIVYDSATGEIFASGTCSEQDYPNQARPGYDLMQAQGDYFHNYVKDGQLYAYTDAQVAAKSVPQQPYMKWSNTTFSWYDSRTSDQINTQTAYQVRAQRDGYLYACDWTQIPNNPLTPEVQQEWAVYRQALRNVPEQPGFPLNVTWPTPPS